MSRENPENAEIFKNRGSTDISVCRQIEVAGGRNCFEITISDLPSKTVYTPEGIKFLEEKGWANNYLKICLEQQPFLPDEKPLKSAYIGYQERKK